LKAFRGGGNKKKYRKERGLPGERNGKKFFEKGGKKLDFLKEGWRTEGGLKGSRLLQEKKLTEVVFQGRGREKKLEEKAV